MSVHLNKELSSVSADDKKGKTRKKEKNKDESEYS